MNFKDSWVKNLTNITCELKNCLALKSKFSISKVSEDSVIQPRNDVNKGILNILKYNYNIPVAMFQNNQSNKSYDI